MLSLTAGISKDLLLPLHKDLVHVNLETFTVAFRGKVSPVGTTARSFRSLVRQVYKCEALWDFENLGTKVVQSYEARRPVCVVEPPILHLQSRGLGQVGCLPLAPIVASDRWLALLLAARSK